MKDYFKPKTWLIAILMFIISFGLSSAIVYYEFGLKENIKITRASASDNVSGFAWSSNIGWISFNSEDCDKNNNGFVDTNAITSGCNGNDNITTPVYDYGAKVDLTTGYFSGYAWSSGVGWISFNRRTCVGGSDAGAYCTTNNECSSNSCRLDGPGAAGAPLSAPYNSPASLDYNAIYSFSDNTVTGWAKILSLGDNGWVKLRKDPSDSGPDYGVSIDPATGDFSGWAWNANDNSSGGDSGSGIGWISFNCNDAGAGGCVGHDYKVIADINRPPTVTNMTAPNWNYSEAGVNALRANLNFDFIDADAGSFGLGYQIIVTKADNTPVLDTGKCTGYNTPSLNCKIDNNICMENGIMGCINSGDCVCQFPLMQTDGIWYGTGYKWSVQVWDNYDAASVLTPYTTNPDTDNNDGVVLTFTTYKHEMPDVDFNWFPFEPSRGEEVKFTDDSYFYSGGFSTRTSCDNDNCSWAWSTITPGVDIVNPTASTTVIKFNSTVSAKITLTVTDSDGYEISHSEDINVNANLPAWKEVKPE